MLQLSGQDADAERLAAGEEIFTDAGSCYDCHDYDGYGNPAIGGAKLMIPDKYVYGSDRESILASIVEGRHGVSPAFENRLSAGEVKAIAVYVLANSDSAIPDEPFSIPPEN